MIKQTTKTVWISTDETEFDSEAEALKHELMEFLSGSDNGIFIGMYERERIANALVAHFNITPKE